MPSIFDTLPSSVAAPASAPASAPAPSGSMFDSLPGATTAPAKSTFKRNATAFVEGAVGITADTIDLVYDLITMPVAASAMAGSLVLDAVSEAEGRIPRDRRASATRALGAANTVTGAIGAPVRKALQGLGLLSEKPTAIGAAMSRAMEIAEGAAANIETNTSGAIKKEEVMMGINTMFAALGARGMGKTAKTAEEIGKSKAALKELAKYKAEVDAQKAKEAADQLAHEAQRESQIDGMKARTSEEISADLAASAKRFNAQVEAERIAYDLMQSGAPTAKVEAASKKNPAVGLALDDIRKRRETAAAFLQEAADLPEALGGAADLARLSEIEGARSRGEWVSISDLEKLFAARVAMQPRGQIRIEPAGSGEVSPTAQTIRSALLSRPSESSPQVQALRDAAAGIVRGPLGEPIFSAGPAAPSAGTRGRSVPDPRRRPVTGSGLMGVEAPPQPDVFGAAATGGRASPGPVRRPTTGSGLEGQPVKRDSLGTPLSPNQTLAVVGATGLGLAAYYAAEGDTGDVAAAAAGGALLLGKGRGISLEAIRALPDTATLREIRDASAYTLNTLENLPGNRAVHSKQAVAELLRRQEVTKAERDILQGVLDSVPGDSITAKQLMAGVKEATGDFELTPRASEEFADYGLANIDRIERSVQDGQAWIPDDATPEEAARLEAEAKVAFEAAPEATTTIYQSPFELGTNNHFNDPNYFAHTRSFYENGIKHVVELQSDLAQKAGKELSTAARAELEAQKARAEAHVELFTPLYVKGKSADIKAAYEQLSSIEQALFRGSNPSLDGLTQPHLQMMARGYRYRMQTQSAELQAKLAESGLLERVSPMLKRWDRRLVREELAASARGRENPAYVATADLVQRLQRSADEFARTQGRLKPGEARGYYEGVEAEKQKLAGMEPRLPPEPVVRFATADTVAKVEGWPDRREAYNRTYAGSAEERAGFVKPPEQRFSPEHQGIYDRYNKEVTSFLKQLGGKEVTDSAGHTWIEVPTEGTRKMPAGKRAQQFGAADPALLAYLATVAGAATAGYLLTENGDKKVSRAIQSGVGAALGGLLILKKSGSRALRESANDLLRGVEDFAGNTSYQIEKISPPVERLARNYKRLQMRATHDRLQAVAPFVEGLRRLSPKLTAEFDAAVLNGDWTAVIRAVGKAGSPELVAQLRVVIDTLKETGQQLKDAGLIKGLVPNYFPRIVNDIDGLLESLGQPAQEFIEKRLAEAEAKAKPFGALTELERSIVLNKALEENLRRGPGMASSFRKGRTIEQVTADMAPFYEKPTESLIIYLRAATNQIERARFFGRDAVKSPETGKINVEASIGNKLLAEKNAGRITSAEFKELERLLQIEFGFSDKVAGRGMRAVQNLTTSALLANIFSAGLNLADIPGTVALMHGILPTVKATAQTITRRPTRVTNADMGLANVIAEEFVSPTRNPITVNVPGYGAVALSAAKFLDTTMKHSSFKTLDAFGKEVAHNAAWINAGRKVSSPKKLAEFVRENGAYFGEDLGQLVSDLRAGKRSELALEYLWKQISDAQPISSLEMPTARTANPNWRFAWQMRSWMIKQMTLMRQKGFDEIRKGDAASVARGTGFLLRYVLFVGSAGAGANFIIQSLLGRDQELEWGDIPLNALKNFGMSQYTIDKVAQGKLGEAVASVLSPPALVLFEIASGKPEAVRNIPLIGRFVYNRMMGGAEKANERAEREERRKEREE